MNPSLATPRRERPKVMDLRLNYKNVSREFDIDDPLIVTPNGEKPDMTTLATVLLLEDFENPTFCLFYLQNATRYSKGHYNLLKMNMSYGKTKQATPRTQKTPRKRVFSPSIQEELTKYMSEYKTICDGYLKLTVLVSTFQKQFEGYSQKKVIKLYSNVFSKQPSLKESDEALISFDENNKKIRFIELKANFLLIAKENKEIDQIIYLTKSKPILIDEKTISIDNLTIGFNETDKCLKWIEHLNKLQPWYVSIPRTVIKKDEPSYDFFKNVNLTIIQSEHSISNDELKKKKPLSKSLTPRGVSPVAPFASPRTRAVLGMGFIGRLSNRNKANKAMKIVAIPLETLSVENNVIALPPNISLLIQYLKLRGIHVEGIFRVSGSKENSKKILDKLDSKCVALEYFSTFDIHSVAGALKLYIKLLPEQVIPKPIDVRLYELWKQKELFTEDEFLQQFKQIFKEIPPMTFNFLKELLDLLKTLVDNKEETKMTVENCVTCLAPSLRGYPFVYTYAIQHYDQLFNEETEETEENEETKPNTTM